VKNAVNLFNPQLVIVGGFLAGLFGAAATSVDGLAGESIVTSRESLDVAPASLGPDQLMVGAAELVFSELLLDPAAILGL
jgi:predicted NBD/HSP70 family sugar kinase